MSETQREQLSALFDGELDELGVKRVLAQHDHAQRQQWQHYSLMREVLRGEPLQLDWQLADRVRESLAQDSAMAEPVVVKPESWWRPFSHLAVAASFAGAVFFGAGWLGWLPSSGVASSPAPQLASSARLPLASQAQPVAYGTSLGQAEAPMGDYIRLNSGLEDYLLRHQQRLEQRVGLWQLSWLPPGYQLLRQEQGGDQQVMTFANQGEAFSVFIEPLGMRRLTEGSIEKQGRLVMGKQLLRPQGEFFVTVAGDISRDDALRLIQHIRHEP
ncbi:RseA family anti-sigma factor [Balneatrix alpica]|uniref:RseA family anti-sigma factor n=1 Tax=Balneatrix alpica TaxID=75684 RepID=UPI002739750B|nr:RseA family anti-sigma factor [Balneatrix alpica]